MIKIATTQHRPMRYIDLLSPEEKELLKTFDKKYLNSNDKEVREIYQKLRSVLDKRLSYKQKSQAEGKHKPVERIRKLEPVLRFYMEGIGISANSISKAVGDVFSHTTLIKVLKPDVKKAKLRKYRRMINLWLKERYKTGKTREELAEELETTPPFINMLLNQYATETQKAYNQQLSRFMHSPEKQYERTVEAAKAVLGYVPTWLDDYVERTQRRRQRVAERRKELFAKQRAAKQQAEIAQNAQNKQEVDKMYERYEESKKMQPEGSEGPQRGLPKPEVALTKQELQEFSKAAEEALANEEESEG